MAIGVGSVNRNFYTYDLNRFKANVSNASAMYNTPAVQNSVQVSQSSEQCTDGKDDGKIGFFAAIGNAIKGVGKAIVNGVKGMFTDSEGKFSLGKTLLSVGTAALCIAVPAVGLAACCVGVAAGAVQVGKGIYNAATATTDAQAKEAWQNIGGGTFTAATSAIGAKACFGAMKATSSAGALNGLAKDATIGAKVKAFATDAKSSTINSLTNIKDTAVVAHSMDKAAKLRAKAAKMDDTAAAEAIWNKVDALDAKYMNASARIQSNAEAIMTAKNTVANAAKHPIQTAGKAVNVDKAAVTNAVKNPIKTVKAAYNSVKNGNTIQNIKALPLRLQSVAQTINTEGQYAAIQQFGYATVAEVLKAAAGYTVANQAV